MPHSTSEHHRRRYVCSRLRLTGVDQAVGEVDSYTSEQQDSSAAIVRAWAVGAQRVMAKSFAMPPRYCHG